MLGTRLRTGEKSLTDEEEDQSSDNLILFLFHLIADWSAGKSWRAFSIDGRDKWSSRAPIPELLVMHWWRGGYSPYSSELWTLISWEVFTRSVQAFPRTTHFRDQRMLPKATQDTQISRQALTFPLETKPIISHQRGRLRCERFFGADWLRKIHTSLWTTGQYCTNWRGLGLKTS